MSQVPPGNPADIAREAFRRLAARRIVPTPEAYRAAWEEIAGIAPAAPPAAADKGADAVLATLALRLSDMPGELAEFGHRFQRQAKQRDWDGYGRLLALLVDKHLRKGSSLELLGVESADTRLLRDLLARTLALALAALLADTPPLAAEAEDLGAAVRQAYGETALQEIAARLKELCYRIDIRSGDTAEQQELLLRLFRLLLDNVGELLEDDSWMRGQVQAVRDLIAGPLDQRALEEAMRALKDVVYRQGQLRHGIDDVKLTVKHLMATFVERLGLVEATTGDFHARVGSISERIGKAPGIAELNGLMGELLDETRRVQDDVLASRESMQAARRQADDAAHRVQELEAELSRMSELVREDQLTGSLNRRGLADVFEREAARADRRGTPLCVAMLDLDNFKRFNDTWGHQAGDGALRHLVRVVKDTLRSIDAVARFGGEEFLILLPETTVEAAAQAMTRLQRELTRHFFLHDNEKHLITFSAGVALRREGEDQESLLARADRAMYEAKQSGKNRVVVAQ